MGFRAYALCLVALPFGALANGPGDETAVVARTCVTCHHPDNKTIPQLPGEFEGGALAQRLKELRAPDNTVMHRLVGPMDDRSLEILADYLVESQ